MKKGILKPLQLRGGATVFIQAVGERTVVVVDHLRHVPGTLRLDDDGNGVAGTLPLVDDQVHVALGVDLGDIPIPDVLEEIGDNVF